MLKLNVLKEPGRIPVIIDITTESGKKPIHIELTPDQLLAVIGLLKSASTADRFRVEIEL